MGEGYPVLDGENTFETLTVHTKNVVVQGLKFIDIGIGSIEDKAAIKILESDNLRILNNKLREHILWNIPAKLFTHLD